MWKDAFSDTVRNVRQIPFATKSIGGFSLNPSSVYQLPQGWETLAGNLPEVVIRGGRTLDSPFGGLFTTEFNTITGGLSTSSQIPLLGGFGVSIGNQTVTRYNLDQTLSFNDYRDTAQPQPEPDSGLPGLPHTEVMYVQQPDGQIGKLTGYNINVTGVRSGYVLLEKSDGTTIEIPEAVARAVTGEPIQQADYQVIIQYLRGSGGGDAEMFEFGSHFSPGQSLNFDLKQLLLQRVYNLQSLNSIGGTFIASLPGYGVSDIIVPALNGNVNYIILDPSLTLSSAADGLSLGFDVTSLDAIQDIASGKYSFTDPTVDPIRKALAKEGVSADGLSVEDLGSISSLLSSVGDLAAIASPGAAGVINKASAALQFLQGVTGSFDGKGASAGDIENAALGLFDLIAEFSPDVKAIKPYVTTAKQAYDFMKAVSAFGSAASPTYGLADGRATFLALPNQDLAASLLNSTSSFNFSGNTANLPDFSSPGTNPNFNASGATGGAGVGGALNATSLGLTLAGSIAGLAGAPKEVQLAIQGIALAVRGATLALGAGAATAGASAGLAATVPWVGWAVSAGIFIYSVATINKEVWSPWQTIAQNVSVEGGQDPNTGNVLQDDFIRAKFSSKDRNRVAYFADGNQAVVNGTSFTIRPEYEETPQSRGTGRVAPSYSSQIEDEDTLLAHVRERNASGVGFSDWANAKDRKRTHYVERSFSDADGSSQTTYRLVPTGRYVVEMNVDFASINPDVGGITQKHSVVISGTEAEALYNSFGGSQGSLSGSDSRMTTFDPWIDTIGEIRYATDHTTANIYTYDDFDHNGVADLFRQGTITGARVKNDGKFEVTLNRGWNDAILSYTADSADEAYAVGARANGLLLLVQGREDLRQVYLNGGRQAHAEGNLADVYRYVKDHGLLDKLDQLLTLLTTSASGATLAEQLTALASRGRQINALRHDLGLAVEFSWSQGHDDTALAYLASNPDLADQAASQTDGSVAALGAFARHHYAYYGYTEGRQITFSAVSYAAANPDVWQAVQNGNAAADDLTQVTQHYILSGRKEGRNTAFDVLSYAAANPDVLLGVGADANKIAMHYLEHGIAEGRKTTFDTLAYGAANPDVWYAFGGDAKKLALHYIEHGYLEGRKTTFDTLAYGAANPDVWNAFGGNAIELEKHYLSNGHGEGRKTTFDTLAYGAANPDVWNATGSDAVKLEQHYLSNGQYEGRKTTFDTLAYGAVNPDVWNATGGDAVKLEQHYLSNGQYEGRKTTFDTLAYGAANPDVWNATGGDAVKLEQHYLSNGQHEGRKTTFDALSYGAANPDVWFALNGNTVELERHYLQSGYSEGRKASFDALSYGAANPDVWFAVNGDAVKLEKHYLQSGYGEGRKTTFDAMSYAAANPDLIIALGNDPTKLMTHYLEHGLGEKRSLTFDATAYAAANPDLAQVFGNDTAKLARHYVQFGLNEGRAVNPSALNLGSDAAALSYLASSPDLIEAARSLPDQSTPSLVTFARHHYATNGRAEGRTRSFDPVSYGLQNPDVWQATGGDAAAMALHYIRNGYGEGRTTTVTSGPDLTADWAALAYVAGYADLAEAGASIASASDLAQWGRTHFVQNGQAEGRTINFDATAYAAANPDLVQAFGNDTAKLARHYVQFGLNEGRAVNPSALNLGSDAAALSYLASSPDLIEAARSLPDQSGASLVAFARHHYATNGRAEGRTINFNPAAYAATYADVAQAYQGDPAALALHYIQHGYSEGRAMAA